MTPPPPFNHCYRLLHRLWTSHLLIISSNWWPVSVSGVGRQQRQQLYPTPCRQGSLKWKPNRTKYVNTYYVNYICPQSHTIYLSQSRCLNSVKHDQAPYSLTQIKHASALKSKAVRSHNTHATRACVLFWFWKSVVQVGGKEWFHTELCGHSTQESPRGTSNKGGTENPLNIAMPELKL